MMLGMRPQPANSRQRRARDADDGALTRRCAILETWTLCGFGQVAVRACDGASQTESR